MQSDAEVAADIALLKRSSAGTGFMHERCVLAAPRAAVIHPTTHTRARVCLAIGSFWKDSVQQYTRPWFAWANSLFAEVVLRTLESRPHLLV